MAQIRIEGTSDFTKVEQGFNVLFDKLERVERQTRKTNQTAEDGARRTKKATEDAGQANQVLSDIMDRVGFSGVTMGIAVGGALLKVIDLAKQAVEEFKRLEKAQLDAANRAGQAEAGVADFFATASPEEARRVRSALFAGQQNITQTQAFGLLDALNAADRSDRLTNEQEAQLVNRLQAQFGALIADPGRLQRIARETGAVASTGVFTPEEAAARGALFGLEDLEKAGESAVSLASSVLGGSQLGAERDKELTDRLLALELSAQRGGAEAGGLQTALQNLFRQQQDAELQAMEASGVPRNVAMELQQRNIGAFAAFAENATNQLFSEDEATRQRAAAAFRRAGRSGLVVESALLRQDPRAALGDIQGASTEALAARLPQTLSPQAVLAAQQAAAAAQLENAQAAAGTDEQRLALIRTARERAITENFTEEGQATDAVFRSMGDFLAGEKRSEKIFRDTAQILGISREELFRQQFGNLAPEDQQEAFNQFFSPQELRDRNIQSGRSTRRIEANDEAVALLREIRDAIAAQSASSANATVDVNIRGGDNVEAGVN